MKSYNTVIETFSSYKSMYAPLLKVSFTELAWRRYKWYLVETLIKIPLL